MQINHLTVEMIEDCLLEFLDITQQKFGTEGFPMDSKTEWLQFKQINLPRPSIQASKRPPHFSSKSQISAPIKANLNEKNDVSNFITYSKPTPTYNISNFSNEFKNLLKNVNDNTRFYENLAFKEKGEEKIVRKEIIDPFGYYTRNENLIKRSGLN